MDSQEAILDALRSLSGKLDGVKSDVADLDKRVEVYATRTELKLEAIHHLDGEQNAILSEHQARSIAIQKDVAIRDEATKALIKALDFRVEGAEMPLKVIKMMAGVFAAIGSASVGVLAVLHFLSKLKG